MENQDSTQPNPTPTVPPPTENANIGSKTAFPFPRFLHKPIALIVIILIIGVFLFGLISTAYKLGKNSADKASQASSPTPTSNAADTDLVTADWKTYTNSKYKFSLKYPNDWSVEESSSTNYGTKPIPIITFGRLSTINHIGEKVSPYVTQTILLGIYNETPNTNLEKFADISPSLNPVWNDIIVGGKKGKNVISGGCVAGDCRSIYFQINRNVFVFYTENSSKRPELDQILSTFRFE